MAESSGQADSIVEAESVPQPESVTEAETNVEAKSVETEEEKLKHLQFVHTAGLNAIKFTSRLYGLAKERSGILKPHLETVEGHVKTHVYDKYNHVPRKVLKFVDGKVHNTVGKLDVSTTRAVATEVTSNGEVGTKAEEYATKAWDSLHKVPLFHHVAKATVPAGAYFADKYNQKVKEGKDTGHVVFSNLPLLPRERLAKIFKVRGKTREAEELTPTAPAPEETELTSIPKEGEQVVSEAAG